MLFYSHNAKRTTLEELRRIVAESEYMRQYAAEKRVRNQKPIPVLKPNSIHVVNNPYDDDDYG